MKDGVITMAHGGGGTRTRQLVREMFLRHFANPILERLDDSACLDIPARSLAFTTDSYVVSPLFFPGGDIGKLAVCGTVNDLAMQAAEPRFLSMGLILEEGLAVADLEKIIASAAEMLKQTGALLVTGDTKVVERGNGNGIFINTAGIGVRRGQTDAYVGDARPGDAVIVTGTLGDHGIAVMCAREGLRLASNVQSDVAPLWDMVKMLLDAAPGIHCMRDPTRGGLAAALCDIAESSHIGIRIYEGALPVRRQVRGACNLLGLDPMTVANEGKAVIVCNCEDAGRALNVIRSHPMGKDACEIGNVVADEPGVVIMRTIIGGERVVEMPSGENLPRIC